MNPETYSYLFPLLLTSGAIDVFLTPIIMKKNRPGNILSCMVKEENLKNIERIIFRETSTFGIRKKELLRVELDRKIVTVDSIYGKVDMKVAYMDDQIIKMSPEYEVCKDIATKFNIPLLEVYKELS